MHAPEEIPEPANLVVLIYGDSWEGGVEGYYLGGQWVMAEAGYDSLIAITGWEYRA
jgi:hypothetical protein